MMLFTLLASWTYVKYLASWLVWMCAGQQFRLLFTQNSVARPFNTKLFNDSVFSQVHGYTFEALCSSGSPVWHQQGQTNPTGSHQSTTSAFAHFLSLSFQLMSKAFLTLERLTNTCSHRSTALCFRGQWRMGNMHYFPSLPLFFVQCSFWFLPVSFSSYNCPCSSTNFIALRFIFHNS